MRIAIGHRHQSTRRAPRHSALRWELLAATLDRPGGVRSPSMVPSIRRTGILTALLAAPALAYRFAVVYRQRAGLPRRRPGELTPADRGCRSRKRSSGLGAADLPAWFIPARKGAKGPGVVLVHGWESNRDRTLPNAQVLHAAGFHVLTFDVRGHGDNPPETLPISVAEFRDDALAALDTLLARPEVTAGGFLGHSLGAVGAILAAAAAGGRCSVARQHVRPRGPAPAHPPDVPARPAADPGAVRDTAGRAHDAGLPASARPRDGRPLGQPGRRALRRATAARPRRARHRRPAGPRGASRGGGPPRCGAAGRGRQASGRTDRDGPYPRGPALVVVRARGLPTARRPLPHSVAEGSARTAVRSRPRGGGGRRDARPRARRAVRRGRDAARAAPDDRRADGVEPRAVVVEDE